MMSVSFDPAAAGWSLASSDVFIESIGPAWTRPGEPLSLGIVARASHDNGASVMHGGALMAFIDYAFGVAVTDGGTRGRATIQLDVQFVAPVPIGAFVVAAPVITRRTKTLAFVRGECRIEETIVATANGIWRIFDESR